MDRERTGNLTDETKKGDNNFYSKIIPGNGSVSKLIFLKEKNDRYWTFDQIFLSASPCSFFGLIDY